MAVRQQILANAPTILVTDRWHAKTSQLQRAGVRKSGYLGDSSLGGSGAQECAVLNRRRKGVGTPRRPVDLTSSMYFAGW